MFYRRFTFWFTLFAIVPCLLNFIGFDRDNALFVSFSVPAWIFEMMYDVHQVHLFWLYSTTILFWFGLGYIIDRTLLSMGKKKATQKGEGS